MMQGKYRHFCDTSIKGR